MSISVTARETLTSKINVNLLRTFNTFYVSSQKENLVKESDKLTRSNPEELAVDASKHVRDTILEGSSESALLKRRYRVGDDAPHLHAQRTKVSCHSDAAHKNR